MTELVASVLVPTYDEAADIEACLEAVGHQSVGAERLEVLLVDGGSQDGTIAIAGAVASRRRFGRFEVVPNPERRTAAGLHRALAAVRTPVVVRVDARSRIGPDHVALAVEALAARPEVGVVGGPQIPLDRGTGAVAAGIARALANRWTTGLARYRRSGTAGPADTVWMGAFRTDELRALGGWDPDHGINEDYELNSRYRAAGATVWFDPRMAAGYLPRPTFRALARQYLAFGRSKGRLWSTGGRPAPRQLVLLAAPPAAVAALGLAARRFGAAPAAGLVVAAALSVDAAGNGARPASAAERAASVVATAVFAGSWWLGVVDGYARARRAASAYTGGAGSRPPSWRSA